MTADMHSLMAPYALNALTPDERARFEAHLDRCATCQAELAGFQATAARLGEAHSQTPPAGLRARILAHVSTAQQERPVLASITQGHGLRRSLQRLAVAAVFLIGAAGVGGYVVERDRAHDSVARTAAIEAVLAAPDASTTSKSFSTGGNLRLVASPGTDSAVIVANDLPALKGGKVYQVWMINDAGPKSQGTFRTSGLMIMTGAGGADSVAVTVEPAGGSAQPTTAPIVAIDI
jgi:anti-sigma-K factor RskA